MPLKHDGPAQEPLFRPDGLCACTCGCPNKRDERSNVCMPCTRAMMEQAEESRQALFKPRSYVEGEVTFPMTFQQDLESKRPETGVCQFGADWPGVFIRGDNAFAFAQALEYIMNLQPSPGEAVIPRSVCRGLLDLLKSSEVK